MNMLPWPQIAIPAGVLVLVALLAVLLTRHRILKKVTYMLDALEDKETISGSTRGAWAAGRSTGP